MKDLTIGIIGTGRIGAQVVRNLSGFGCRILAYDLRRNPAVEPQVTYVDFDTLLAQSDVITLHMPLLDSNRHIINRESVAKMRDGVVIVNCSRGELADIEALIEGIETGKIGALGMDTVEGDEGIIHADHRVDILPNRNWFYLPSVPQCHHDPAHGLLHRCRRVQHGGLRHRWRLSDGRRRVLSH